jgi:LytS/YehU family sensor histidine kinase
MGVYHAIANYYRYRERNADAEVATAQLTQARLHALTTQLQPHFLFNTLNSVSALVGDQPGEARRVLASLSALLRATLDAGALDEVPLHREVALLESYLEIEKTRFGDRIDFAVSVPQEVGNATAPGLILQPLVENAIRHGFGRRVAPGRVVVTARRENGALELHVVDDGDGLVGVPREGIGLGNTRRRLIELYGSNQALSISSRPTGGVHVRIRIPYRTYRGQAIARGPCRFE